MIFVTKLMLIIFTSVLIYIIWHGNFVLPFILGYYYITWNATSENRDVVNIYGDEGNGSTITFRIRKNCLNAGRVNKFGDSFYNDEDTIIPPYSVWKIRKKIKKEKNDEEKDIYDFVVDLAFDNSNVDFSNLPIF